MFQPKQLFRDLDRLLHERERDLNSTPWFRWLVDEIVKRFGEDLHMASGRLYEEDQGGYRIVHEFASRDPQSLGLLVPSGYRPLELVLEHGVYIFDRTVAGQSEEIEGRLGGLESAAILVNSEPKRILAYGLLPGWQRDDLDFVLNTFRNAIDLRVALRGLQTDIEQAAEIQQSLLPETPPEFPGFSVAARSVPAARVGGDFYDYFPGDPETLVLAVGDASGHGLAAALLARDTVTGIRMGTEGFLKTTEIVRRLNRVISKSALSSRFVSLFYGDLERNGNIFYVNAGHPAPWIVGKQGLRRLHVGGTILGPVEAQRFRRGWAHLDRGGTLVAVTDGILEHANARGEQFGEERVDALVTELDGRPAPVVLDALFEAARKHGRGKAWEDDTTALVVTRELEKAPTAV